MIKNIFRYPIKGLSPESLNSVLLNQGAGVPLDRALAISHVGSKFSFDRPSWVSRGNFIVVAHSPNLATVKSHYDSASNILKIGQGNQLSLQVNLDKLADQKLLSDFLQKFIGEHQTGPYKIAKVTEVSLTDSPEQAVSIMNLASLRELEKLTNMSLDRSRFRGNFWFESEEPWCELDWLNKDIVMGGVQLRVIERIQRCPAVDANPQTGVRDTNLLKTLNSNFRHKDFGVLAKIVKSGSVALENSIDVLKG